MTHAILALLVTAALSGAAVETTPVQAAPAALWRSTISE